MSLKLKQGQYLKDILTEIPTNTILKKRVTGCGATSLEIENKTRNSIIIEPNVPAIQGKMKKYPKILCGVMEGVNAEDIMEYIQTKKGYKKIMTTPESFPKVIKAMNMLNINYLKDYFLLFDECDKIIKDIDYRKSIELPMKDFFKFKNKALVSATPIQPSDPRFKQQDFEILEVIPDYDYKKDIQLVTTNNVIGIFRKILEQIKPEDQVCFFVNKTTMIQALIEKFDLKNETKIFCSDDSVENLRKEGYDNAYSQLQELAKYNFFTSRFYSAVDIELETKPVIVMLTDLFYSHYTVIDPATEAIQIVGRFRNGHCDIIHITNYDYHIHKQSEDELLDYLKNCEYAYNQIKFLKNNATSNGAKDSFTEALRNVPFAQFINEDGTKNYFSVDNWIDNEIVKGYYKNATFLYEAYQASDYFNITHTHSIIPFPFEDYLIPKKKKRGTKKRRLQIIEMLEEWKENSDSILLYDIRETLHQEDPLIVEAFENLDIDFVKNHITANKKLELEIIKKKSEDGRDNFAILNSVYAIFKVGKRYPLKHIKQELLNIFKKYGDNTKYKAAKIEEYFKADNIYINRQRGYILQRKLY